MIEWKEKFSEEAWSQTSNQVLIVGLLDSTHYDPTAESRLLLLNTFGKVDPALSSGWQSKFEAAFTTNEFPRYEVIPGLSGKYDDSKNYPLAYITLGDDTNGNYTELDAHLMPIRKIEYWAEITQSLVQSLDWFELNWKKSKAEYPDEFYPSYRENGIWIGKKANGEIVLNIAKDEDGEQWFYRSESNVAKVYGIDSHTKYNDSTLTSVAFVEFPQSKIDRVQFVL